LSAVKRCCHISGHEFIRSRHRNLTLTEWLILFVAILGFAFDTYELLMLPLIARPALAELLHVDPATASGNAPS